MRKSGVLMHISSLPSRWGIGSLGDEAIKFVDFLAAAGQSFWQVLPVSPTGFGDSPYQAFSSFAGNPYFIDLDLLCRDGLLEKPEYAGLDWGSDPERVDYGRMSQNRPQVLRRAAGRLLRADDGEFRGFCAENSAWLDSYALFMAIKDSRGGRSWENWEEPLRLSRRGALDGVRASLQNAVDFHRAVQFFFFRQWDRLKRYANGRGVSIIGDLPIYAAADSADVWENPRLFRLDDSLRPVDVAGCPPDGFCPGGQLWGNPLYRWEEHRKDGFSWWADRIKRQFALFDLLRIDHFRGFAGYYAIPAGARTAQSGHWEKGPGMTLFSAVGRALGAMPIIAEDLGFLDDSVRSLLEESGFPGMRVMQFAFSPEEDSRYLPHNYVQNCVAYTGTHDNTTARGWFESAPQAELSKALDYLRIRGDERPERAMLRALWGSAAGLVIAPVQDLLGLGPEARMNTPGTLGGNWQWRLRPNSGLAERAGRLRSLTALHGRL